jgi:hypothetical protein
MARPEDTSRPQTRAAKCQEVLFIFVHPDGQQALPNDLDPGKTVLFEHKIWTDR